MVGLSLSFAATPAEAQSKSAKKCEKLVKKSVKQFTKKGPKKMQKCANKGIKKGTLIDTCFVDTTLKNISAKKCSSEALDELGYKQECGSLNPACADRGQIVDAASLHDCLQCHLNHETRCMIAVTYNATAERDACFPEPTS